KRKQLPIEEKESYRWLQSVEATTKAMEPETHIITVADREADIFELFALPRPHNMDLLIRAVQDRRVQEDDQEMGKLWKSMEALPASGETITTHIEHKPGIPARNVTFALRWRCFSFPAPAQKKKKYTSIPLTAILVTEIAPQEGREPLSWLLLTTLSVQTFA